MNRRIALELERTLRQRGEITWVQREYAKTELRAIKEICPVTEPSEEERFPHRRTLKSYIGEQVFNRIVEESAGHVLLESQIQAVGL